MRRSLPPRIVSLLAVSLVVAATLATPAWADDGFGGSTTTDQSVTQNGGGYAPRVVVTTTTNGTTTSATTTAAETDYVHPPCWYQPSWTGPELAEYYDSNQNEQDAHHHDSPELLDPPPGYADHKNDGTDKGQYYGAICSSQYWDGDIHSFTTFAEQWINSHPTIWVAANDPDPNTNIHIPDTVLMHIAQGLLTPTAPKIEFNPTANSVVNLPTWVWARPESFVEIRVRAEFNGTFAEVVATPQSLNLSTNGPADVKSTCAGGGQPWKQGKADSDCTVTFRKSTASAGSYQISASINWKVTWHGTDHPDDIGLPAPANPPADTQDVAVDEVQTVVTGRP
jgi:hypothetical protein